MEGLRERRVRGGLIAVAWHYRVLTPTMAAGGVAVVRVAGDLARFFIDCGLNPIAAGGRAVRLFAGLDRGLMCRWNETVVDLMPHGGMEVVRAVAAWLESSGGSAADLSLQDRWPEAATELEARVLEALALTQSPIAADLLLRQLGAWEASGNFDPARDATLNRLLDPPLVVAIGPANVGKSSLLNALAGRVVSIVADEPGTTRDHVGVLLNLDGLAVRYADTPGLRSEASDDEREAIRQALTLLASADLILSCGDATAPAIDAIQVRTLAEGNLRGTVLTVGTRQDLGPCRVACTLAVSVRRPESIGAFAMRVREELVPSAQINDPRPWRFWKE